MNKSIFLARLIAALMATGAPAHAQTAGLTGWTAVGDVTLKFDGDAARLSTASSASSEITLSGFLLLAGAVGLAGVRGSARRRRV